MFFVFLFDFDFWQSFSDCMCHLCLCQHKFVIAFSSRAKYDRDRRANSGGGRSDPAPPRGNNRDNWEQDRAGRDEGRSGDRRGDRYQGPPPNRDDRHFNKDRPNSPAGNRTRDQSPRASSAPRGQSPVSRSSAPGGARRVKDSQPQPQSSNITFSGITKID